LLFVGWLKVMTGVPVASAVVDVVNGAFAW
jgi:hypothetical protein